MIPHEHISSLFAPRTIAVVGASATPGKVGHTVLANLLEAGFTGTIFPVNPYSRIILGLSVLSKAADIQSPVDLAVICLPAEKVEAALGELATLPTKAVVIMSTGFKETGSSGTAREDSVKKLAKQHGIALLGPNCLGFAHSAARLNATCTAGPLPVGTMGFFSQSRGLFAATSDWAKSKKMGFSTFVSLGNKALLDESDILSWMAADQATRVISGYLENIESGARFMRNAHQATREKPVILLRGGGTKEGKRASAAHGGIFSGKSQAYEAAFRQTGIIQVDRVEELFHLSQAFASQPLPKGPGLAVITNAGGPGIIAVDACENSGLTLSRFSTETLDALREFLPSYAAVYNPVDVIPDATPERFVRAANLLLDDTAVHSLLILVTPTMPNFSKLAAEAVVQQLQSRGKPVFACFMGGDSVAEGRETLTAAGIPCYEFPEQAVDAIAAMHHFALWRERPLPVEINYRHDLSKAQAIVAKARETGLNAVEGLQAQSLLKAFEMPLLEAVLARTSAEAAQAAKQLGLPVLLELAASGKEARLATTARTLDTVEEVRDTFLELTSKAMRLFPESHIEGCLVQPMPPKGAGALTATVTRDLVFGPVISLGLANSQNRAGYMASRIAPLCLDDVHDMVREAMAASGKKDPSSPRLDLTALEDILLILSQLALEMPEVVEAVCGPIFVSADATLVAKARFLLAPEEA